MIRSKISVSLLAILIVLIALTSKLLSCSSQPDSVPSDLVKLIRTSYDSIDDPSFSKICDILNDSIQRKLDERAPLELLALTLINEYQRTVDWDLIYSPYNVEVPPGVPDRLLFNITFGKDKKLKIQNSPAKISDIQDLTTKYIFYPDSAERNITHRKSNIDQIGECDISKVSTVLEVYMKGDRSFSTNDWRIFFNCLHKLIESYDSEKNKVSLRIFGENYDALSFEDKIKVADIINFHIYIRFY